MANTITLEHKNLQNTKPSPQIFWLFIEEERNNILKEYEIRAGQGVTINLGTTPASVVYHYPINAGYFAGRDQREVIQEAIEWWSQYLDRIDKTVAL